MCMFNVHVLLGGQYYYPSYHHHCQLFICSSAGKLAEREILNQNKREEKICIEIL